MPQMSPMNWVMILATTTIVMIQMNSLNFFDSNKIYKIKKNKNFKKKKKNWKW
uniref:ATP synthase F0 subunit 8 n=1 Tax=Gergithus yunnanensis TaxID=1898278 RepID=UPI002E76C02C|nr:ATP synthase F0 subunit 8 [Gergithus yunnanensis]WQB38533.1 ATP synthase F0 subunit 8 [Gergithus yunnanensis]